MVRCTLTRQVQHQACRLAGVPEDLATASAMTLNLFFMHRHPRSMPQRQPVSGILEPC